MAVNLNVAWMGYQYMTDISMYRYQYVTDAVCTDISTWQTSVCDRCSSQIAILPGAIQNITSNHFVVLDVPGSRVLTMFNTYINVLTTSILLTQCVSHEFFVCYELCPIFHILLSFKLLDPRNVCAWLHLCMYVCHSDNLPYTSNQLVFVMQIHYFFMWCIKLVYY